MNTEDFIDFFQMKKELSLSGIYLGNNGFLCFVRVGGDVGRREEGGAFLLSCQVDKVTVDLLASIVWREVGVRQEASVVTEEEGSSRIHSGSSGKLQNTQEQQWSLTNEKLSMCENVGECKCFMSRTKMLLLNVTKFGLKSWKPAHRFPAVCQTDNGGR